MSGLETALAIGKGLSTAATATKLGAKYAPKVISAGKKVASAIRTGRKMYAVGKGAVQAARGVHKKVRGGISTAKSIVKSIKGGLKSSEGRKQLLNKANVLMTQKRPQIVGASNKLIGGVNKIMQAKQEGRLSAGNLKGLASSALPAAKLMVNKLAAGSAK